MQTSIAPAFKKGKKNLKTILDQLVSCVMFRRYLKDVFSDRYQIVWVTSYQNINVDFWEGYSTQHCVLSMFEKRKRAVHNEKAIGLLLTD